MDESILNSSSARLLSEPNVIHSRYSCCFILFSGRATEAELRAGTSIPGRLGWLFAGR